LSARTTSLKCGTLCGPPTASEQSKRRGRRGARDGKGLRMPRVAGGGQDTEWIGLPAAVFQGTCGTKSTLGGGAGAGPGWHGVENAKGPGCGG
jgi:hypothetical protein